MAKCAPKLLEGLETLKYRKSIHSPKTKLEIYEVTTFWISWIYNMNHGTLLDLHEPPNGPRKADFRRLLPTRVALQAPFKVHIDQFSFR